MAAIIETQSLTKVFNGLLALKELTISIEEGAVVGFIGPNGAGKTTTMRILTTLLKPSRGRAWVAGHSVSDDPQGVRRAIGYMPDFFGVYEDMKVWEYLDFFAACYAIPESTRRGLTADLLALVDLGHKADEYVENLSRGMKQRLCLARTLTHDPEVLILDEPASGLDPRARIEMRELLRELKNMGKTIFFSSHILSEVADICNQIAILEAGSLVAFGDMADIRQMLRSQRLVAVRALGPVEALREALAAAPGVSGLEGGGEDDPAAGSLRFHFAGDDQELSRMLAGLIQQGFPIVSFSEQAEDLEDVFMQVTKGVVQ
ncbi:MAG: ATP-binding cassette domain-containing protein [Candidatus Promineifilaceae bacterium]